MNTLGSKGKGKAAQGDGDIDTIVTYRHLLTNKMGVMDPLRVIALCDLDAFYAAAERVRLNLDPNVPMAVQQWQGLIAVNYPARTFGISRMETVTEAKKKCPELVLVHVATFKEGEAEAGYWENPDVNTHKVSLDHYRRESMKILQLHRECMPPGVEVEKASIDEAFFDFTVAIKETVLARYPHLAQVPPEGLDAPLPPPPPICWNGLGNLVPVDPKAEAEEKENVMKDVGGSPGASSSREPETPPKQEPVATWHDLALSIGAEIMMKSRAAVKSQLGYTTTAGLARNKMLAKLVASYKKQDQQTILRDSATAAYLHPMPFQKIRFLGGKLGDALADEFKANTVGDVLDVSLEEMQKKFGEESIWVYNLLRGIDHTEVKEKVATKSMLASKNVRPNITKDEEVVHWLRVLSSELSVRLVEARELSPTIWPKTLVLHFRQAYDVTKSKQAPFPFSKLITPELILNPAMKLFKELSGKPPYKISNIGLAFAGLGAGETGQQGIEGFFGSATMKDPGPGTSSGAEDSFSSRKRERGGSARISSEAPPSRPEPEPLTTSATSFQCSRCKKTISLPKSSRMLADDERAALLQKLRSEHDDFHVAQDLAREVIDVSSSPESTPPPEKRVKVTKVKTKSKPSINTGGIAKYFQTSRAKQ